MTVCSMIATLWADATTRQRAESRYTGIGLNVTVFGSSGPGRRWREASTVHLDSCHTCQKRRNCATEGASARAGALPVRRNVTFGFSSKIALYSSAK